MSLFMLLHSIDFRMLVSSNSWSKHVKLVFEDILDDWKYSSDLHPHKKSLPTIITPDSQSSVSPPPSPVPVELPPPPVPIINTSFPCPLCERVFPSARALSGHMSTGQKVLHPLQRFAGATATCQCCLFYFASRPRLLGHLRKAKATCGSWIINNTEELPDEDTTAARKLFTSSKCPLGQTRLTATIPAYRVPGPLFHSLPLPPLPPPSP